MSSYTDGLILEYLERVANAYENYIAEHNRCMSFFFASFLLL